MAGYIGKVQIGTNDAVLIGSTLYGICKTSSATAAKTVISTDDNSGKFINNNYDNLIQGTTIHVKFIEGNSVESNATLKVGTTNQAKQIVGKFTCTANTIISFTYDENEHWVVNDNVDNDTKYTFSEGSTTGAFSVSINGAAANSVTVHGLKAAAYKTASTTITSASTNDELPTAQSVYSYVQAQTGGLAGLTGAMHFRGIATTAVTDGGTQNPAIATYDFVDSEDQIIAVAGDVVLWGQQEFVWTGSVWELLGDEGSYALKTNTATVIATSSFTANTLPSLNITDVTASQVAITPGSAASLTTTAVSVPNVTQAGIATTASVTAGILNITLGQNTVLGTAISINAVNSFTANTPTTVTSSEVTIGSASGWSAGSQASLTTSSTAVVVP